MARKIGIRQNAEQRIIGGARVAFDPRITARVLDSIDPINYRAQEEPYRKALWQEREAEKRSRKSEAA